MARRMPAGVIVVRGLSAARSSGILQLGALVLPCRIGRTGRRAVKREGDGASPIGVWPVRRVLYRADRLFRPRTGLPIRRLFPDDGWCDAPADRNYNRFVRHPYPASAENLWRSDGLYDLIVVLGHNERPRKRFGGSAIFLHVWNPEGRPTAGCVAVARPALVRLIGHLRRGACLRIVP